MNLNLIYPKENIKKVNPSKPLLPDKNGNSTGYSLIGIAQNNSDIYVCFSNELTKQVWIEKTHKLLTVGHLHMEQLEKIKDNQEFALVYKFFLDTGLLGV